jgi:hypothetical protein
MKGLRRLMPSDSQRSRLLFDGVTRLVSEGGYLAIVGLMFAENIFPPIPSELIMPLAGYVCGPARSLADGEREGRGEGDRLV